MLSYFLFILQAQFKHYYKKKKKDPHRQRQGQGHVRIKSGWNEKQATENPAETRFRLSMPQKLMISKTACQWFLSGRHSIYKWNIFYSEETELRATQIPALFRLKLQCEFLKTKHGSTQFFNLKLLTILKYWRASGVCINLKFEKEHPSWT